MLVHPWSLAPLPGGPRSRSSALQVLGDTLASQTSAPHATDSQQLSGLPLVKVSPSNGIPGQSQGLFLWHRPLMGATLMGAGTKASEDKYILLAISSDVGEWRKYPMSDPRQLTRI